MKRDATIGKRRKTPGKHKADHSPGQFFNRELSWLAFNERVLEEAADARNPLIERVKFASITASNLDEFFMVRVARLKHAIHEDDIDPDISGLTPARQLREISERAHAMIACLYRLVMDELLPALGAAGIRILDVSRLDSVQHAAVSAYLRDEVLPALTPLAIDASRPFPMLSSLSLNIAVRLTPGGEEDGPRLAVVQVPSRLPRLVRVAGGPGVTFVLVEDVIRLGFDALFPGQAVVEAAAIRLARDSELELDDEGGQSYVEVIQEELRQRRRNDVVRLEVEDRATDTLLDLAVGPGRDRSGRHLPGSRAARRPRLRGPRRSSRASTSSAIRRTNPCRCCSRARTSASSISSIGGTCCCITRTTPSIPWSRWSSRPPTIPTCSPSSRRSTARAATRRSSRR